MQSLLIVAISLWFGDYLDPVLVSVEFLCEVSQHSLNVFVYPSRCYFICINGFW